MAVSFLFVYLVRLFFQTGNHLFPEFMPALPTGPWPDLILFVNLVAMAFLLEIALKARSAIDHMRSQVAASIETNLPIALRTANMADILSRLFPDQRRNEALAYSGERVIEGLRRFLTNLPDNQRAFILWLVAKRLPDELHLISQSLQGDGLEVSIDEEIEAERFLADANQRFQYVERAIPDNFRASWTDGWLNFLPEVKTLCPNKAEYYFVTSKEVLRAKKEAFLDIHSFLKTCGIALFWCDINSLKKAVGIDQLKYSAIAAYSDDLGLVATGVGIDGDWAAAVGKITIKIVEMNNSQHARLVIDGVQQYSLSAAEAVRQLRHPR